MSGAWSQIACNRKSNRRIHHGLLISRRIPVAVQHDESRRANEVESRSAALRTQEEDERLRLGCSIKSVDHLLSFALRS